VCGAVIGAAAGRGAHYQVEASLHYPNEFVDLVAAPAKGRRGSSWDHIERSSTASMGGHRQKPEWRRGVNAAHRVCAVACVVTGSLTGV
jgi:hypothetical protein